MTTWERPATFWNNQTVRDLERASIRDFVESCSAFLTGRVLDYGCGKQPYRHIVEDAGGEYVPYDRASLPANVSGEDIGDGSVLAVTYDVVLCNQVAQYWRVPFVELDWMHEHLLGAGGVLVMTFPTNWDEVEPDDLFRYTAQGMRHLLTASGFTIERMERRAEINLGGFRFPLGYGVVARA